MVAHTIPLGDRFIHYALDGDPEDEAMVLVSGHGADHRAWDKLRGPFLRKRLRLVRMDNRDAGRSWQAPEGTTYTPRDMARDVLDLADGLQLGRFHLVGMSLGGAVAQEVALHSPERLLSLQLVTTWARSTARWGARYRRWREDLRHLDDRAMTRRLVEDLVTDGLLADQQRVDDIVEFQLQLLPQQPRAAFLRQLDCAARHDVATRLSGLDEQVPVHIVLAERDILIPSYYGLELAGLLSAARLSVLAGAPHGVTIEASHALGRHLTGFVDDVRGGWPWKDHRVAQRTPGG